MADNGLATSDGANTALEDFRRILTMRVGMMFALAFTFASAAIALMVIIAN